MVNDNRFSCYCKFVCLNNLKIFCLRVEEIFLDIIKECIEGLIEIVLFLFEFSFLEYFFGV